MTLINLIINNKKIQVEQGTTILDAAKKLNIKIPTLCHMNMHDNNTTTNPGSCRVCMVEVEGRRNLAPACSTPVAEGMVVKTNSIKAINARKTVVELMLSDHPSDCLICERNQNCELQKLACELGIRKISYYGKNFTKPRDVSSKTIVRDLDKCILCRRCETVCSEIQTVNVLSPIYRGFKTKMGTAFDLPLENTNCTYCGQCVSVCPTGALTEMNYISNVLTSLNNDKKIVIAQIAPAVRASLGEEFGYKPGTVVTGKLVSALKTLGFYKVFDTNFGADLTVIEEASEFLSRLKNNKNLPMITSCCPGWINFLEHDFSDLIDLPSTCKSPQQMFGTLAKTYFASKSNLKPENIVLVSIMPCLAKKHEAARPEFETDGIKDVDFVLTTRELAKMIKESGIDFNSINNEPFDTPLGYATGASIIFGTSGGVVEAAIRTIHEWITNEPLDKLEFQELRESKGFKTSSLSIGDRKINVAIVNGLGNARTLLESVRKGNSNYDLIEIMACPGGCVGGGGQPYIYENNDILKERSKALYNEDRNKLIRQSHKNPYIQQVYKEFLHSPCSYKALSLLHTHYSKK